MIDIKRIHVEIFKALSSDSELLSLLEIDSSLKGNDLMSVLREQIIDNPSPDDLLNNYATRLCIYENNCSNSDSNSIETGLLCIDIHCTQDKNNFDRRLLKVAQRVVEVLDSKERQKQSKQPLNIGLDGLKMVKRSFARTGYSTGWNRYSIYFEYKFFK